MFLRKPKSNELLQKGKKKKTIRAKRMGGTSHPQMRVFKRFLKEEKRTNTGNLWRKESGKQELLQDRGFSCLL